MDRQTQPDADLVLYDAANMPGPRRVRMCLVEKGLPFKIRWLNLGLMDQKAPSYLALNPTGMVPTLVRGDEVIFDSAVINEYLDAIYPDPPLTPADPLGKAQMRMWFAFEIDLGKPFRDASYETMGKARLQNTGITPAELGAEIGKRTSNPAYLKFAMNVLTTPTDHAVIKDRLDVILEKIEGLESKLADGRPWLCGEHFTLADITVGPRMDMFPSIGVSDLFGRYPMIGAWMARLKARPSWARSAISPAPGELERMVDA